MVWFLSALDNRELDPPERIADVYVFCLLKHKCQNTINPLDVEQWEFFVVPRSKLDSDCGDSKSIGLNSLSQLTKGVSYDALRVDLLPRLKAGVCAGET